VDEALTNFLVIWFFSNLFIDSECIFITGFFDSASGAHCIPVNQQYSTKQVSSVPSGLPSLTGDIETSVSINPSKIFDIAPDAHFVTQHLPCCCTLGSKLPTGTHNLEDLFSNGG